MTKLSIIVVCFNRLSHLEQLLWNIFNYQDIDLEKIEILVIDDGSVQEILPHLRSFYRDRGVRYIRLNRKALLGWPNGGMSRCYPSNVGAYFSRGENLLFCDSEILLINKEALRPFIQDFKYNHLSAILEYPPLDTQFTKMVFESYKTPDEYHRSVPYLQGKFHSISHASGFFCVRKDFYIDMGGMNEDIYTLWGDDLDFTYRMKEIGIEYVNCESKICHLDHGGSGNGDVPTDPYRELINGTWTNYEFHDRIVLWNNTFTKKRPFNPNVSEGWVVVTDV